MDLTWWRFLTPEKVNHITEKFYFVWGRSAGFGEFPETGWVLVLSPWNRDKERLNVAKAPHLTKRGYVCFIRRKGSLLGCKRQCIYLLSSKKGGASNERYHVNTLRLMRKMTRPNAHANWWKGYCSIRKIATIPWFQWSIYYTPYLYIFSWELVSYWGYVLRIATHLLLRNVLTNRMKASSPLVSKHCYSNWRNVWFSR